MNGSVRSTASSLESSTSRRRKSLPLIGACALGLALWGNAALASPVELITNGGFETGNLSGWTATSSNADNGGCNTGWNVSSSGSATGCYAVSNAMGTAAVYQSFDGTGPKTRTLSQSFVVPSISSAMFSFFDSYQFNVVGDSQIPRTLDVNLASASGTTTLYHFASPTGTQTSLQNWKEQDLDVTAALKALQGQLVTLSFVTTIPETFSGPAGFGLDNVSLDAVEATVPEPASLALAGLALVGLGLAQRRRRG